MFFLSIVPSYKHFGKQMTSHSGMLLAYHLYKGLQDPD